MSVITWRTIDTIQLLIKNGGEIMESYNTEYKESMPKAQQMKAEIVSFLNSNNGGTIFLGVDDNGDPIRYESETQ